MVMITFDQYEQELLRFFAKRYDETGKVVGYTEIPRYGELGRERVLQVVDRLERYGIVRGFSGNGIEVCPTALEYAGQLDNPPLKDYWKSTETWLRSKWWSVPLFILFVGLPAIVGYLRMIGFLLSWLMGGDSAR